jgi:hemerythrin-like domain-containing protein
VVTIPATPANPSIDDASRPRLPALDPAGVTDIGRAGQEALTAVHEHLRQEMRQVIEVLDKMAVGSTDPAVGRSLVNRMTMRQNYWSVGAFCATYCRILTLHHTIEDQRLFRDLRDDDVSLSPVLERLSEEHEVIAGLLDRLDRALIGMVDEPGAVGPAREEAAALSEALLSHLDYEEEQLLGPLGRSSIIL